MSSADNQSTSSDNDLMNGIVQGEGHALSELYDRYGKIVFAVCMRSLKNREHAEEVTSKVFWEIWDRGNRYDPSRGSVQAYLLTIARSRAVDRLRSQKSKTSESKRLHLDAIPMISADGVDPSSQLILDEWRVIVNQALNSLDPAQKQAIELAFHEGLTHQEIAAQLGKPLGTIKSHIRKGLLKLRHCLAEFEKGRKS